MIRPMGWIALLILTVGMTRADTFSPKSGGSPLHGYMTSKTEGSQTVVVTQEKGSVSLNLSDYKIQPDTQGRQPNIALVSILNEIDLEMETAAFEKGLVEEADRGPLFILIEIDTPGGRVDLVKRICSTLSTIKYCPTVAYIRGGQHGGAYSGGAVLAMACQKLYMAKDTAIGAASMVLLTKQGAPLDLKKALGEDIGEKMNSAWRNYVGSLAEQNNRPGLLAKAMVDKEITAVEIQRNGKRQFVEPFNQQPGDKVVKTWSRKGSLLTLTGSEAVQCGIADGTAANRDELLAAVKASSASIQENSRIVEARKQYEDILKRFKKLNDSLDLRVQKLDSFASSSVPRAQVLKTYQGVIQDIRALIRMAQACPDLPYSQDDLKAALNAVQAQYDAIRVAR
jgi:membrane-bound ClpP family serine protease